MSVQAISWVLDYSDSLFSDRLILIAIANHCDRYGTDAWPLQETIAAEARVSTREVVRAIQNLVSLGELSVQKGKGQIGRNLYSLPLFQASCQSKMASDKLSLRKRDENAVLSDKYDIPKCQVPHRNKEEPSLTVLNTLSSPSASTGDFQLDSKPHPPKKKQSTADPRHRRFMELIFKAHEHYVKVPPLMGPSVGNNLKRLLSAAGTKLDEVRFRRMLTNYHESEDHAPADSPTYYIPKLPRYETGTLNKFGRADAVSGQ